MSKLNTVYSPTVKSLISLLQALKPTPLLLFPHQEGLDVRRPFVFEVATVPNPKRQDGMIMQGSCMGGGLWLRKKGLNTLEIRKKCSTLYWFEWEWPTCSYFWIFGPQLVEPFWEGVWGVASQKTCYWEPAEKFQKTLAIPIVALCLLLADKDVSSSYSRHPPSLCHDHRL